MPPLSGLYVVRTADPAVKIQEPPKIAAGRRRVNGKKTAARAAVLSIAKRESIAVATRGTILARTRFIDLDRAAGDAGVVQLRDRRIGFLGIGHLDEPETAGPPGELIHDHARGRNRPERGKGRPEILIGCLIREITNEYIHY